MKHTACLLRVLRTWEVSWGVIGCPSSTVGGDLDLADRLWDSGFRDVNAIDKKNEACLTKLGENNPPCDLDVLLQKAHWLISKGADIHHQDSSGSALHALGDSVGTIVYWLNQEEDGSLQSPPSKIESLSEASKKLLITILSETARDDCECACSPNGCFPLTTLLSGLFPT